jgi:hypothetical protein
LYNITELTGSTVTIKLSNGIELIADHLGYDSSSECLTVGYPKVVVLNGSELALIPYTFTGDPETVVFQLSAIHSIVKTLPQSEADYRRIVDHK